MKLVLKSVISGTTMYRFVPSVKHENKKLFYILMTWSATVCWHFLGKCPENSEIVEPIERTIPKIPVEK